MPILILAWKSLLNRRLTVLLTLLSIALSVALLVGVERIRTETRASFASTLSGTDLIVGARSGSVQLMLYTLFRIGSPTNNLTWESYQAIAAHPKVSWSVPLSLGDSHRGYRVLGTTVGYFEHYRFARDRELSFTAGGRFDDLYDVVLGAEVAERLGYQLEDPIIIAHGAGGGGSFAMHDDRPFRVVGILARTGTPVDRTLHVSLEAIEAIHLDWRSGMRLSRSERTVEDEKGMELTPAAITAALIGLKSPIATFQVQRFVNDYPEEPLTAVLPGVALSELWSVVALAERALLLVSVCVVVVGLVGMLTALLTSLAERRREMAILRSVGARPGHIFALIMGEAGVLTLLGVLIGLGLLYLLLLLGQPLAEQQLGLFLAIGPPAPRELLLLTAVTLAGITVGAIPAYRAYRFSLSDGLSIKF